MSLSNKQNIRLTFQGFSLKYYFSSSFKKNSIDESRLESKNMINICSMTEPEFFFLFSILGLLFCLGGFLAQCFVYVEDTDHAGQTLSRRSQKSHSSDSDLVDEFTRGSSLVPLPTVPDGTPFTLKEINFVCRMVCEELLELVSVHYCRDEKLTNEQVLFYSRRFLEEALKTCDNPKEEKMKRGSSNLEVLANEVDAFGDAVYFLHNATAKKGISLSSVVRVIHEANMNKRFANGQFHRRESDNKIIKPEGWTEPDILVEMMRQMKDIKA
jgi:predicted HAD superfamily Cof-like phosphohydrolase